MGNRIYSQNRKNTSKAPDPGRFDFVGKAPIFCGISVFAFIAALILIFSKGLNYGIDFAGGTEIQVQFNGDVPVVTVRKFAEGLGFKNVTVQSVGGTREYLIRFETVQGASEKETNQLLNQTTAQVTRELQTTFSGQAASIRRIDTVGPQVGKELKRNGVLAAFYSLLLILIYIGLRFDYSYAPGAVLCLFHDAIVVLGLFSALGKEVNIQIMAAILTLIGYSLNDTIINFDRIRENIPIFKGENMKFVVNRSVNDVLSRTLLTSMATLLAVGALFFLADGVLEDLAFTLGIGIFIGTYSSIYVANPLLIWTDQWLSRR